MNNLFKKLLKNATSVAKARQKFASAVVFKGFFRKIAQTARLMVGIGDYETYRLHYQTHHPKLTPMTREQYFLQRLHARYPHKSGDIKRCPC
jgi:uncharacterized short protein YbdD (DUF466 family)